MDRLHERWMGKKLKVRDGCGKDGAGETGTVSRVHCTFRENRIIFGVVLDRKYDNRIHFFNADEVETIKE